MTQPVRRLAVYREPPEPVPLRAREHAPACLWCRWRRWGASSDQCMEPRNNPGADRYHSAYETRRVNPTGECQVYQPSRWTALLQWLRIRPFLERSPHG